jgi:hypothetical protein
MQADTKHYQFINSQTGNTIYYHAISAKLTPPELKKELEKVKAQVAVKNALFLDVIYWEEIQDDK